MVEMDEVGKYRLLGAAIWLTLLILIVPGWYSHPVNFQPQGAESQQVEMDRPLVEQAYVLPVKQAEGRASAEPEADSVKRSVTEVASQAPASAPKAPAVVASGASAAKPSSVQNVVKGQWLVKVASYKELKEANELLGRLDRDYPVWIKEFTKSKTYSVRTGPYSSRDEAQRDKQKIDKAFHTQAIVVQVK
ncbi:SPOR domain-containing protein [Thiomicrorhabdus cannonii]|uniref:SPOR domain-containing protein n=1 Tax=Thiomicrorhabdus cannonii TaxID=2748011 RepID=UPI0015BC1154|nr:SPOR domain-containing protein [Thiomicrorhabdus cannonii]